MDRGNSQAMSSGDERDAACAVPPMAPDEDEVLVRMYGQGMGDCFLLAFPRTRTTGDVPKVSNGRPVFVLIDCGIMAGTPNAERRMRAVVRDIWLTTKDSSLPDRGGEPPGHLDLLVLTNGNPNHTAGFSLARDEWEHIQVDALWTAWTEGDTTDEVTDALRRIAARQRQALSRIAEKAASPELEDRLRIAARIAAVVTPAQSLEMEGDGEVPAATAIGRIAGALVEPRDWIACEPGEVRRVPGSTAHAYVLGPPRDWDRLLPISPKRRQPGPAAGKVGHGGSARSGPGKEARRASPDPAAAIRRYVDEPSALNAVVAPLLGIDNPWSEIDQADRDVYERTFPFDRRQRVPLSIAEAIAAAHPREYRALAAYFDDVSHWRRIDYDWLAGAESFALQVDNLINNTSLVLAIELPQRETGTAANVLLFASDAQAGNWMSWDDIPAWRPRDGARPTQKEPEMADLLRRTALYKVGHHGANNATPKELGLDRLSTDGALTAFVPASRPLEEGVERWPNLPQHEVMDALNAGTGGRVVLSDGTVWPGARPTADALRRLGLTWSKTMLAEERNQEDQIIIAERPLWVQMAIPY